MQRAALTLACVAGALSALPPAASSSSSSPLASSSSSAAADAAPAAASLPARHLGRVLPGPPRDFFPGVHDVGFILPFGGAPGATRCPGNCDEDGARDV